MVFEWRKKKNLRRIHLILKIRKDDIEMYQD